MKLIVGLGNVGEKYTKTRHNIGFRAVELMAEKRSLPFREMKKIFCLVAKDTEFLFVKPSTFMNDSGKAVRAVCDYFHLNPETDLIVIHDDLDLTLGSLKRQHGTGPKVHNGLSSIYQHLGTKNFLHIRLGIDGRAGNRDISGSDYVLASFTSEENVLVQNVITQVMKELLP